MSVFPELNPEDTPFFLSPELRLWYRNLQRNGRYKIRDLEIRPQLHLSPLPVREAREAWEAVQGNRREALWRDVDDEAHKQPRFNMLKSTGVLRQRVLFGLMWVRNRSSGRKNLR